jgi:hypothetical protein
MVEEKQQGQLDEHYAQDKHPKFCRLRQLQHASLLDVNIDQKTQELHEYPRYRARCIPEAVALPEHRQG